MFEQLKSNMSNAFNMTDLCLLHYMSRCRSTNIFVSEIKYAKSLLDEIRTTCEILSTPMEKGLKRSIKVDSKVVDELVYKKLVWSLILLTTSRPDLSNVVSFISSL